MAQLQIPLDDAVGMMAASLKERILHDLEENIIKNIRPTIHELAVAATNDLVKHVETWRQIDRNVIELHITFKE